MTHLAEIHARALEIAAESDRKLGPYFAEIIPCETPAWYMVRTAPGQENKAYKFLAARRFGPFLPTFVKGSRLVRQHQVEDLSDKLIFPGRVFVWVWDVLAHWRRIMNNPGVQAIITNSNAKPVVVPDTEIDHIKYTEQVLAVTRRKRRKRYSSAEDRITITPADYLHIDGYHRTRVLDAVLLRATCKHVLVSDSGSVVSSS